MRIGVFSIFSFGGRVRKRVVVFVVDVVKGVAVASVALLSGVVVDLSLGAFQVRLFRTNRLLIFGSICATHSHCGFLINLN